MDPGKTIFWVFKKLKFFVTDPDAVPILTLDPVKSTYINQPPFEIGSVGKR
jgi:hypothetical protein